LETRLESKETQRDELDEVRGAIGFECEGKGGNGTGVDEASGYPDA